MSVELETGLPSTKLLQTSLHDKKTVTLKLLTGETFSGTVRWQDPHCVCLNVDNQTLMIWRQAIAYLQVS
jgi:host factor-I protein